MRVSFFIRLTRHSIPTNCPSFAWPFPLLLRGDLASTPPTIFTMIMITSPPPCNYIDHFCGVLTHLYQPTGSLYFPLFFSPSLFVLIIFPPFLSWSTFQIAYRIDWREECFPMGPFAWRCSSSPLSRNFSESLPRILRCFSSLPSTQSSSLLRSDHNNDHANYSNGRVIDHPPSNTQIITNWFVHSANYNFKWSNWVQSFQMSFPPPYFFKIILSSADNVQFRRWWSDCAGLDPTKASNQERPGHLRGCDDPPQHRHLPYLRFVSFAIITFPLNSVVMFESLDLESRFFGTCTVYMCIFWNFSKIYILSIIINVS